MSTNVAAIAPTVAGDDLARLPLQDRIHASIIYDKLRLGLPVSDDDVRHLHDIYARHHHRLVASSLAHHWPCHRHD
jgi:hypothetical protein